jgi:hypothetical protein
MLWGIVGCQCKGCIFEGRNNIDINRFRGMRMYGLKPCGGIQQFGNEKSFISCLEICPNILH